MAKGSSRIKVAVGTSNPMKVRAVREAFSLFFDADIIPVNVDSGVPRQPSGIAQVYLGAINRAIRSLENSEADFGVGVEAGPVEAPAGPGFLETQVAVIVDRECRASVGLSPAFELERSITEKVLMGVELSAAAGITRPGGDIGESIGVIGIYTWGAVTRQDLTRLAVIMALVPWVNRYQLYKVSDIAARLGVDPPACHSRV